MLLGGTPESLTERAELGRVSRTPPVTNPQPWALWVPVQSIPQLSARLPGSGDVMGLRPTLPRPRPCHTTL